MGPPGCTKPSSDADDADDNDSAPPKPCIGLNRKRPVPPCPSDWWGKSGACFQARLLLLLLVLLLLVVLLLLLTLKVIRAAPRAQLSATQHRSAATAARRTRACPTSPA